MIFLPQCIFEGVATAVITPFSEDSKKVDYKGFSKLVEHQTDNKADALVICGTTGESPVLTSEEKSELFRLSVSLTDGKIPIIAGTGSNNTEEAVRKSNDAEKMGVNGLLIVTPYYNKCTQEGLIKHYNFIADRVSAPIIVYNVPSRTGVTITPEAYLELSKNPKIAGVKEASSDIASLNNSINLCNNNLTFYTGNDEQTAEAIKLGCKGVISVAANIIPSVMKKITNLTLDGDYESASELHKKYLKLINAMFCEVNPIPVKYACSRIFETKNSLRLPLTRLSAKNSLYIDSLLKEYELIKNV